MSKLQAQMSLAGSAVPSVWEHLEHVLVCPECSGALLVSKQAFACQSCKSTYPVEDNVPLLLRPADITSAPDRVMEVFGIPACERDRLRAALAVLVTYRSHVHPEFDNFFARFDPEDIYKPPVVLSIEQIEEAVGLIEGLTFHFPKTARCNPGEYRSIRIRNRSDRILFTDARNKLFISYKLYDGEGRSIPFEATKSPLPCPVQPGRELTIPVLVDLPTNISEEISVRFYFVALDVPVERARSRFRLWLGQQSRGVISHPPAHVVDRWFDRQPIAEMVVTPLPVADAFNAERRGEAADFNVHRDVRLADDFLSDVIRQVALQESSPPVILEIGAGVHPIALRAESGDATILVSDISLVMQRIAAITHTNYPAVIENRAGFLSFDMMHAPFREGSFDVICICAALHHIPSPYEFMKHVRRLIKPTGRFVALREPCRVSPHEPTYISELENGFNEQMFELSEWKNMMSQSGFVLDKAVIDFECSLKFSIAPSPL